MADMDLWRFQGSWEAGMRRGIVLIVCSLALSLCSAQERARSTSTIRPAPKFPPNSLTLAFGGMAPLSHNALTQFWNPGPSAALTMYVNVNRYVALGVGAEAALFFFDRQSFEGRFPNVPAHQLNTANLHIFVGWKYTGRLGSFLCPTLGATLGASKMTKALYQQRVAGIRQTYYEIPGMTRATLGATAGLEFVLSRSLALLLEGRAQYLHNDPEVAFLGGGRTGIRINIY